MPKLRHMSVFLLAATLFVSSAMAQPGTGTLRGTMTDDSGAVIPAANVTLTGNGVAKTAQTQADGTYVFQGLAPGPYAVKAALPGFATINKPVTVTAGGNLVLPIQMVVASEKQEITVADEATTALSVEPDNNATALVLRGEDLAALPDDPDDLSDALQALAGPGAGPNGGSIYIDGFSGGQLPPKESIREIRINSNPFSAEYDRLGFGRIEILTKPGTDHFHGMGYFNDTQSVWDSRNPFASNKPPFSNRNFGGNGGGPINHKTSFNFDIQRRQIQNKAITNAYYVDPASFAVSHLQTSLVTPTYNLTITPRIDYAISDKNTLTVRFEERINSADNQGFGSRSLPTGYSAPDFPNELAYNTSSNAQNLMVTETSILTTHLVNETRFQFQRSWSETPGNLAPEISVANEFTSGGNGIGDKYDLTKHFELTNTSTMTHGAHTLHFGARVRRDSDQNQNPQGFNGTFSFLGGLQQYITTLQLQQQGYTGAQIEAMGAGPSKFSIQAGHPYVKLVRRGPAPFIQGDLKVRPP